MSAKGEPRALVPLACTSCGGDLEAGAGDRVGLCFPCRGAFYLGESLVPYPLRYAAPRFRLPGELRYLPFWMLEASWYPVGDPAKVRFYSRFPTSGRLLFPAFWRPRLGYFEDMTWRYLTMEDHPTLEEGDHPLLGGVRSPEIVPEMGRVAVLSYMDRVSDVGGVRLEFEVAALRYVGIPFWRDAAGWTEGLLGMRFPKGLAPA